MPGIRGRWVLNNLNWKELSLQPETFISAAEACRRAALPYYKLVYVLSEHPELVPGAYQHGGRWQIPLSALPALREYDALRS